MPEEPWETHGIHAYCTIIQDEGIYKMWYDAMAPGGKPHQRCLCYTTSTDGLNWQSDYVNLFEWEGIARNNIVMPGATVSVFIDPKAPPQ